MIELPNKRYQIIYADPPWQFRDTANAGKRGAFHKYEVMPIEDIRALPIHRIAAPDCLLAMWWVDTMPLEALSVCKAWGFDRWKMLGFDWSKLTKHGKDHFGMGHWTRGSNEACLFAFRGKPKPISHSVRGSVKAKTGRHSEKPAEVRDRLVQLMGDVPRIELFARERVEGWDAFGLEV